MTIKPAICGKLIVLKHACLLFNSYSLVQEFDIDAQMPRREMQKSREIIGI